VALVLSVTEVHEVLSRYELHPLGSRLPPDGPLPGTLNHATLRFAATARVPVP
jgi:hypothetical protein